MQLAIIRFLPFLLFAILAVCRPSGRSSGTDSARSSADTDPSSLSSVPTPPGGWLGDLGPGAAYRHMPHTALPANAGERQVAPLLEANWRALRAGPRTHAETQQLHDVLDRAYERTRRLRAARARLPPSGARLALERALVRHSDQVAQLGALLAHDGAGARLLTPWGANRRGPPAAPATQAKSVKSNARAWLRRFLASPDEVEKTLCLVRAAERKQQFLALDAAAARRRAQRRRERAHRARARPVPRAAAPEALTFRFRERAAGLRQEQEQQPPPPQSPPRDRGGHDAGLLPELALAARIGAVRQEQQRQQQPLPPTRNRGGHVRGPPPVSGLAARIWAVQQETAAAQRPPEEARQGGAPGGARPRPEDAGRDREDEGARKHPRTG